MLKNLLKYIADRLGYIVLKKGYPVDMRSEKEFIALYERIRPFTMVSPDRSFALYKAVAYVHDAGISGDIVECGVWRGGQSMLAAEVLLGKGDTTRTFWLYDTYTGMSEPTEHDVYIHPEEAAPQKWERYNRGDHNEWCYAPLEDVKQNLLDTKYPEKQIKFVQGKVEDTIPAEIPNTIALLRLDTDWYESTLHELEHLYPRLAIGGVLLIDDYGSWDGARKAVDEYFAKHQCKILLNRAGEGRVGVKIA